jgi:hypothetical protein
MVSFIIPALDEERRLASLIDDINRLSDRYSYEIIVSDGFSKDNTAGTDVSDIYYYCFRELTALSINRSSKRTCLKNGEGLRKT